MKHRVAVKGVTLHCEEVLLAVFVRGATMNVVGTEGSFLQSTKLIKGVPTAVMPSTDSL
jgi:hypothetical protein